MLSFKEFLIDLPGDPTPEEAQARYREYLVEYHGGEIKAEFAEKKNDERCALHRQGGGMYGQGCLLMVGLCLLQRAGHV